MSHLQNNRIFRGGRKYCVLGRKAVNVSEFCRWRLTRVEKEGVYKGTVFEVRC